MTVTAVLASLIPILWESGIGSDVMKPIAAPIVGGMITSTIHVLILVPVFFAFMKERALRRGALQSSSRSGEAYDAENGQGFGIREEGRSPFSRGCRIIEMQIDWMNIRELSECIPPAFSEYILNQFKKGLGN